MRIATLPLVVLFGMVSACQELPVDLPPRPASLGLGLTDPDPEADGLFLDETFASCLATVGSSADLDHDGVRDTCESLLLSAFRPLLYWSPDCSYDAVRERLGGDYLYAVQRASANNTMRIALLPAIYRDCGLTTADAGKHSGDSELILIDVEFNTATYHWETKRVFLSAHCGSFFDHHCRWHDVTEMGGWVGDAVYPQGHYAGAPYVFVSYKKHANYPTTDACTISFAVLGYEVFPAEQCPNHRFTRWPTDLGVQHNIGSPTHPFPYRSQASCVKTLFPSALTDPNRVECIWDASWSFHGWQAEQYCYYYVVDEACSGPYGAFLRSYGEFGSAGTVSHLTLVPSNVTQLIVGESARLGVEARNSSGNPIYGRPVVWWSSNTGKVYVDQEGDITGVSAGSATVIATVDGVMKGRSIQVVGTGTYFGGVTINGNNMVGQNMECGWIAATSGGNSPFIYEWSVDGQLIAIGQTENTFTWTTGTSPFTISVTVTDRTDEVRSTNRSVVPDPGTEACDY